MKAPAFLIDTSVLISIERGEVLTADVFKPGRAMLLSSVVHAELLVGFDLDKNLARAARARAFFGEIRNLFDYVEFGSVEAECYAELTHFATRTGSKRSPMDTLIAAVAKTQNATILTHDRAANFAGLPGVKVEEV